MKNRQTLIKKFNAEFKMVNIPPTTIVKSISVAINFEKPDLVVVISLIDVSKINTKVKNINTFLKLEENSIILY